MSKIRLVLFIGAILLFLYVINFIVYDALASILLLTTSRGLVLLATILAVFSGSFIGATILGIRYYNVLTRLSYLVTAIWMGFFAYLFFASFFYGIVVLITNKPEKIIGIGLIIGAILISFYGMIHARKIHVKHVEIGLHYLPQKWYGRKAIWISDIHLGQLHGPTFARRVVEKINAIPHDIVFVGGDLFDGTGAPDIDELISPMRELSAPLGTYFITGNHEEFGNNEKFITAVRSAGMQPLLDELIVIDGVQIIGADYQHASNIDGFKTILSGLKIDREKPSILLKHEPKDINVAHEAGVSFQISGHTHRAQLWPLGYLANFIYKGFAYGLKNFKEMQVYTE
jgi:predicted MPP superfamily phosphohydrolase